MGIGTSTVRALEPLVSLQAVVRSSHWKGCWASSSCPRSREREVRDRAGAAEWLQPLPAIALRHDIRGVKPP